MQARKSSRKRLVTASLSDFGPPALAIQWVGEIAKTPTGSWTRASTGRIELFLAALLLGATLLVPAHAHCPAHSAVSEGPARFDAYDKDKDGYLSMEEFVAAGKDDLAFRAADIDGDNRIDPREFAKYKDLRATE